MTSSTQWKLVALTGLALGLFQWNAAAQITLGTAFSYQGSLADGGAAASGAGSGCGSGCLRLQNRHICMGRRSGASGQPAVMCPGSPPHRSATQRHDGRGGNICPPCAQVVKGKS